MNLKNQIIPSSRHRRKRFLGTLFSTISAFVVQSGIWTTLKIACSSFLEVSGSILIGELFDYLNRPSQRRKRGSKQPTSADLLEAEIDFIFREDQFIENTVTGEDFADGCHSILGCGEEQESRRKGLLHDSAIPKSGCFPIERRQFQVPAYLHPDLTHRIARSGHNVTTATRNLARHKTC